MPLFTPDFVLNKLIAGNQRFVASKALKPNQSAARRVEIALGQAPFAAVLGCSDSRLPPEVVFDCGLGDLFTIRTAGHVLDDAVLGSIEYAVEHLDVSLVIVLGHERCGAVKAYIENCARHGTQIVHRVRGHLHDLVEGIAPAAKAAHEKCGDLVENTMREHVRLTTERIVSELPRLQKHITDKSVGIVGARYDLDDGDVRIVCGQGVKIPKPVEEVAGKK